MNTNISLTSPLEKKKALQIKAPFFTPSKFSHQKTGKLTQ
jgi:hypothetical protein